MYIPEVQQLQFILGDPSENPIRQTKLEIFKETLTQMQIANDIRPKGYLLRFNSLLFWSPGISAAFLKNTWGLRFWST